MAHYVCIDGTNYPIPDELVESIRKKEKKLTYKKICKKLQPIYYIESDGYVDKALDFLKDANCATSKEQLESILALNKLANVAKYLNDGWLPDWDNKTEPKYYMLKVNNHLEIRAAYTLADGNLFFKSWEHTNQAIEILGEKEIFKALTLNH